MINVIDLVGHFHSLSTTKEYNKGGQTNKSQLLFINYWLGRMPTQFALATEYPFAVPSDIMAMFRRKHNSAILWLLSSQHILISSLWVARHSVT